MEQNEAVLEAVRATCEALSPFVGFPKWESSRAAADHLEGLSIRWGATAPSWMGRVQAIVHAAAVEMGELADKEARGG